MKIRTNSILDYDKWEYKGYGSGNSRNGYYHRNSKTIFVQIELHISRYSTDEFKQETVRPYARDTDNIENMVITLYKKGITKKNSKYI